MKIRGQRPRSNRLFDVVLITSLISLLAVGCDSSTTAPIVDSDGSNFSIPLPKGLTPRRALELDVPVLRVNGSAVTLAPNADQSSWTGSVAVPENQEFNVSLTWRDGGILLARADKTFAPLTADAQLELSNEDYVTSPPEGSFGGEFDVDEDSYSNLFEIVNDFDPLSIGSPGARNLDLVVPWIPPAEAPVIDGIYDTVWNNAVFDDLENMQLAINNLMIDQGSTIADDESEFRWYALHDDVNLYIFVEGEPVETATLFGDSDDMNDDDSISLFLDGNNSKSTVFDGTDDLHAIIPLLKRQPEPDPTSMEPVPPVGNHSGEPNARVQQGTNSVALPAIPADFEFVSCVCTNNEHTWEIRINLAAAGLTVGQPFGIEIQLNDDNDGGERDAKWGWKHPSRETSDVDNTIVNPSFMGTATLFRAL